MKIKTSVPIIKNRLTITRKIAKFWDTISNGWQEVWGPHIHHGYYESGEEISPLAAQEKLLDKLIEIAQIPKAVKILDAGCGLGGSSIYLAKRFNAEITGITLSRQQVGIAQNRAKQEQVTRVFFKIEDALNMNSFANSSFDVVWSLESCEQFYDKPLFIKHAFRVLKTNGKLMLATWCSDKEEYTGAEARAYKKLCYAFDLPYMPTIDYYRQASAAQGFSIEQTCDWTAQVKKSWDVGISLVAAYSFFKIIKLGGLRGFRFTRQIRMMRLAFRNGMVRYAVFLCKK